MSDTYGMNYEPRVLGLLSFRILTENVLIERTEKGRGDFTIYVVKGARTLVRMKSYE